MSQGIPIRQLAELTGVATTTLRAWERRYGLLKPARTPKGHRLYSQHDVALVQRVVALLQQGRTIGDAARQLLSGEEELQPASTPDQWLVLCHRMIQAVEGFHEERLEQVYNEALSLYPFDLVTERLVRPTLTELGERWRGRPTGIGEEHFFSAWLRNKLGARLHHEASRSHGARLLVASLPDEYHELGALLFSLGALARGYRVLYLGASFPLNQLQAVAERSRCAAILLSGTTRELDPHLEVAWHEAMPITLPLYVGGRFAERYGEWISDQGATPLAVEQAVALDHLQSLTPPFSQS